VSARVPIELPVRHVTEGSAGEARTLSVPSDLSILEHAIDVITAESVACGVPDDVAQFKLRVALSEALSNAIIYGNGLDASKPVEVVLRVVGRRVEIHITDQGAGFDPETIPDPTAADRLECPDGRGLFLIRNLVDDVMFNDRGNAICLVLHRD